jgi:hypothetical protein
MRPEKFGIAIDSEMANWLWGITRLVHRKRNAVVVRLLQIARQDLAPFEGKALARVIKDPWQAVRDLPALRRQIEKRGHGHLASVAGVRLTVADYVALRDFAKNHNTTTSAGLRQIVHRILATETT